MTEITNPLTGEVSYRQQRILEFGGTDTDFVELDLQAGNTTYDIRCTPPQQVLATALRGFTVERTLIFAHDVCLYDGTAGLNTSSLLAAQPIPPNAIHSINSFNNGGNRRLLSLGGFLAAGWIGSAIGALVSGQNPICGLSFGLLGCKSGGDAPDYSAAQVNQLNKLNEYLAGRTAFDQAITDGFSAQDKINFGFVNVTQTLQSQLDLQQSEIVNLNQSVGVLAQRVDNNDAKYTKAFNGILDATVQLANAQVTYADTLVQNLQNFVVKTAQSIVNSTRAVASNVTYNQRLTINRLRQSDRARNSLTNSFARARGAKDERRTMSPAVWANIDAAAELGFIPMKHPDAPGLRPTAEQDMLRFDRELLVDTTYINWINDTTPGSARVHQLAFTTACAAGRALDAQGTDVSWQDLFEVLGPAGCTRNATLTHRQSVDTCKCWVGPVTHMECRPRSGFHWDEISGNPVTRGNRAAYVLSSSNCFNGASPTVNTNWHGRQIDTLNDWLTMFKPLCATKLSPDIVHPHRFQYVSVRGGVWDIPPPTNPDICSFDVDTIFDTDGLQNTLPFVHYITQQVNYAQIILESGRYDAIKNGIIPAGLDEEQRLFSTTQDGKFATCIRTIMSTHNQKQVPVSSVRRSGSMRAACTIQAFNRPRICPPQQTCPPTRVQIGQQITSSFVPNVPAESLLPTSEDIIHGEILGTGGLAVYDVTRKAASLEPYGRSRADTVDLILTPVPAGFNWATAKDSDIPEVVNLKQFYSYWGPFYSHAGAAPNVALTERTLDSHGKCIMPATGIDPNWLCGDVLENWCVNPATDMRGKGQIILDACSPWEITGTAVIDMGPVLQRVVTGCPEYSFEPNSDGSSKLWIYNSLPTATSIVMKRSSTKASCASHLGDKQMTLEPKETWNDVIPVDCGTYTVQLFQLGTGGELVACDIARSVTVNPLGASTTDISTNIQVNQTYLQDQVLTGLQIRSVQDNAMLQLLVPLVQILVDPNLSTDDKIKVSNKTIQDAIDKIRKIQTDVNIDTGSARRDLATLTSQFNILATNVTAERAKATAQFASLNTLVAAQHDIISNITAQNLVQKKQIANLVVANNQLIDAINNAGSDSSKCSNSLFSGWDLSCGIGNILTKILYLLLIAGALTAAIWVFVKFCLPLCQNAAKSASKSSSSSSKDTGGKVHYSQVPTAETVSSSEPGF